MRPTEPISKDPTSKSNSISSSSALTPDLWLRQADKNIWRAIDFLHISVMLCSLFTAIIVAILEQELLEQCPLYAKLYLRANATIFSNGIIDQQTVWGNVNTCEFVSFAYLSAFVVSFISLWVHVVFRRVVRTERLLRLPIGLITLTFAIFSFIATLVVTDGVIKFCVNSQANICASSGATVFSRSRWKIISLPVGGWLTTLSILLNAFVRGIQLFSKPKKSPDTLKILLSRLVNVRQLNKAERESSEYESQISQKTREQMRSKLPNELPMNYTTNREFSPELYPYYYPPVPQYRQIKKRSKFSRFCCPCFRRRKNRRPFLNESYRPYAIPDEYFHRLNCLKQNGTVPMTPCCHHPIHHPVEQQTQTESTPQRKSIDETNEVPVLGRRRSSVRFEDENPVAKIPDQPVTPTKPEESVPIIHEGKKEKDNPTTDNNLERNVSFRNNEDDLWTTITVNMDQSILVQSSHFNRLSLQNSSFADTSMPHDSSGVTAVHVNSKPSESIPSESTEKETLYTIPQSVKTKQRQFVTSHHKRYPPPPPPSRCHTTTTTSDDDNDLRHVKPVEEISAIVSEKYNYNNLSKALKSNVERLKSTFIDTQENQSHYDRPKNIRTKTSKTSFPSSHIRDHSSNC